MNVISYFPSEVESRCRLYYLITLRLNLIMNTMGASLVPNIITISQGRGLSNLWDSLI